MYGGFSLATTIVALLQIQKHRVQLHPNLQKIKYLIKIIPPNLIGGIIFVVFIKFINYGHRNNRISGAV